MNSTTKTAQNKIISVFMEPVKREIAELQAENDRRQKIEDQYLSDLDAGLCVAEYGVECPCIDCENHSKAYDAIENKPPNITPYDALIQAGFDPTETKKQIDIFKDLGVID